MEIISRGGDQQAIIDMIRNGNLGAYFKKPATMDDYVRMSYTLKSLQTGDVAKLGEYANYTTIICVPLKSTVIRLEPIALTTELSGGNVAPITLTYNDKNITGVMGPSGTQYPEGQGREWDPQMTDNTCIILG